MEENNSLMMQVCQNKYFKYVHPLDFSINRKNIHPLLDFPESPYDMIRMKANVRSLINEIPINEILYKKDIDKSPTCTLCNDDKVQSVCHVISECKFVLADKTIMQTWEKTIFTLPNITNVSISVYTMLFQNSEKKSQFLVNPYSNHNGPFQMDFKNNNIKCKLVPLTKSYLLRVLDILKLFQRKSKNEVVNPKRSYPTQRSSKDPNGPWKPNSQFGGKKKKNIPENNHLMTHFFKPKVCAPKSDTRAFYNRSSLDPMQTMWDEIDDEVMPAEHDQAILTIESPNLCPIVGILSKEDEGRSKKFFTYILRDSTI